MTLVDAETGEIIETLDVHSSGYSGLVHHLANRYPMMKAAGLDEMALDIAAHGQREPIWLDIEGHLIDGRNRLEACRLAGVSPRFKVYEGDDIEAFIVSKNEHRRDLSAKERQEIRRARAAELRGQGMSTRAIAEELEVSHTTVENDLARKVATDLPSEEPTRVVGKDGKTYSPIKRQWTEVEALNFLDKYEDAGPAGKAMIAQGYGLTKRSAEATAVYLRKKFGVPAKQGVVAANERRDRIRDLASTSMSSEQIGAEVGLTATTVRLYARDMGIEIAADKVVAKTRRIDANRVVQALVDKASYDIKSDSALAAVNLADLDPDRLEGWISSLADSITSLTTLKKRLKELTR